MNAGTLLHARVRVGRFINWRRIALCAHATALEGAEGLDLVEVQRDLEARIDLLQRAVLPNAP